MKMCVLCGENPRHDNTRFCRVCYNRTRRERLDNNPEIREERNKRKRDRYGKDENYRKKVKVYSRKSREKHYYEGSSLQEKKLAYNKTEAFSKSMIKCLLKKLSDKNLEFIENIIKKMIKEKEKLGKSGEPLYT